MSAVGDMQPTERHSEKRVEAVRPVFIPCGVVSEKLL